MKNHTRLTGLALMLCVAGLGCAATHKGSLDTTFNVKLLGITAHAKSPEIDAKFEWDVEDGLKEIGSVVVGTVKFALTNLGIPVTWLPTADGG